MKNRIVATLAVVFVAASLGGCGVLCKTEEAANKGYDKYVEKSRPDYAVTYQNNFHADVVKKCAASGYVIK